VKPSHRGHHRVVRLAFVAGLAVALAACLPATVARPSGSPPPTARPTPTPEPTPPPPPAPPTPTPAPTFALYTVKRGDTLSSIAKTFKTDARSVSYWNRDRYKSLDPEAARYAPDRIKVGWVLQIMPGQKYVPPEDDGESGEQYTPPPDDLDPEEPEDSASPSTSVSPAP
jgi:hypothetical protein